MWFRNTIAGLCLTLTLALTLTLTLALSAQAGPFDRGGRDLLFQALDLDWAPMLPEVTAPELAGDGLPPVRDAAITFGGRRVPASVMRILGDMVLRHRILVRLKF